MGIFRSGVAVSLLRVLLLLTVLPPRAHGFREAFMNFSHTNIRQPVAIKISFIMSWDLELLEEIKIHLPRFTNGRDINIIDDTVTYDLKLSPSIAFMGAWVEGSFNDNEDPYSGSYVLLKIRDPKLLPVAFDAINITILESNGIFAYCGFAASFTPVDSAYELERFLVTSTVSDRAADNALGTFRNTSSKFVTTPIVHDQFGRGCSDFANCNGYGSCDFCKERCVCNDGFGSQSDIISIGAAISGSCTERVCPFGIAISDVARDVNTAHGLAECSNAGVCNRVTGTCECRAPWSGSACDRRECPNRCSGHGQCVSMAEMTRMYDALPLQAEDLERTKNIVYGVDREKAAWDADIMQGCVCESRWPVGFRNGETQLPEYFGADCSLRRCPSGDDPFTREEETNCRGYTLFLISACSTLGSNHYCGTGKLQEGSLLTNGRGKSGNLCHIDCSGRGTCDYTKGICHCFPGSYGDNCGAFSSPGRVLLE